MARDYKVQAIKQLGEASEYGTPYSVKFAEESETVFMLAKNAPVEGQTEHGDIFDADKKSGGGTYRRFKRVSPDQQFAQPSLGLKESKEYPEKTDSINRAVALKAAVDYTQGSGDPKVALDFAETFLAWLKDDVPKLDPIVDAADVPGLHGVIFSDEDPSK